MSEQQNDQKTDLNKSEGITSITVAGFKSIAQEQRLEVRPLTILAGANSSGKSSIMQPLLLLKQTLDATYDPGALLLNGPNVRFTSADQILSKTSAVHADKEKSVRLDRSGRACLPRGGPCSNHNHPAHAYPLQFSLQSEGIVVGAGASAREAWPTVMVPQVRLSHPRVIHARKRSGGIR